MKAPSTKIALQCYTIRDFLKTPEDMEVTFKKVREIGYEAVQLSGLGEIEPARLKDILDKNGLYCCASHDGIPALTEKFDETVKKLKTLECPFTAIGHPGGAYWSANGIKELAKILNDIGKRLLDNGIRFGYHNHKVEFEKFTGKVFLEEIYDQTDPKYLMGEIDTFWVQHGGSDPALWIRKLKGRMKEVHFKDMTIRKDQVIMAEIGEGNLNWKEIIKACEDIDARWYIIEQDKCERDPLESAKISLDNLKKMGVK